MKELIAINGIFAAVKTITKANGYSTDIGKNVSLGRVSYGGVLDLPVVAVAPSDGDNVNNKLGDRYSTEYNLTSQIIVEAHIEVEPTDISAVYLAWRDITKAVLTWVPDDPSLAINVGYANKAITFPDDANHIAVISVVFTIQYIETLTT